MDLILHYQYKKLPADAEELMPALLNHAKQLSEIMVSLKSTFVMLKIQENDARTYLIEEYLPQDIKQSVMKYINDENNNPPERFQKAFSRMKPADKENLLESFNAELINAIKIYLIYFPNVENLMDKFIQFISKTNYQIFLDYKSVYTEQLIEWKTVRSEKCDRYYVELYENNTQVISMFVWKLHFDEYLLQKHFSIVKNILYSLNKFVISQREIPNSSILLHSFASTLFNSVQWYTSPMSSMAGILKKQNIKFKEFDSEDPYITNYLKQESQYFQNCVISRTSGFFVFVDINDMKNLWLEGYEIIKSDKNENSGSVLVKLIQQKGGSDLYFKKYKKYKHKYLKLSKHFNGNLSSQYLNI